MASMGAFSGKQIGQCTDTMFVPENHFPIVPWAGFEKLSTRMSSTDGVITGEHKNFNILSLSFNDHFKWPFYTHPLTHPLIHPSTQPSIHLPTHPSIISGNAPTTAFLVNTKES